MLQGVDPSTISQFIDRVPEEFSENPGVLIKDPEARIRSTSSKEIFERWQCRPEWPDEFNWAEHWHRLSYASLARTFSTQELYKLWLSCFFASELTKHMEENDFLVWKISNSLWNFGCERGLNRISEGLEGLKKIRVNEPDFEVRITWTRYFNPSGSAQHVDPYLYLDAPFGLLIYYKGKHVLTCGFAIAKDGIQIAQIQMREKKGNRFLYKLPMHYVDFCLKILSEAFPDDNLWIVEGLSAVRAIKKAYGSQKCTMTEEDETRIRILYNRVLTFHVRTRSRVERQNRLYIKLRPRTKRDAIRAAPGLQTSGTNKTCLTV